MARKVFSYSNENVTVKLVVSLKEGPNDPSSVETETVSTVVATRRRA